MPSIPFSHVRNAVIPPVVAPPMCHTLHPAGAPASLAWYSCSPPAAPSHPP